MADPLDSLAQYVAVDLAIGALGTVTFQDNMPDAAAGTYDTAVLLVDTGGPAPALTWGDDTDYPTFQIVSRSLSADTAKTNLQTIFQGIHGVHETMIHSTYFKLIAAVGGLIFLGRDVKQRYVYTQSFRTMVRGVSR